MKEEIYSIKDLDKFLEDYIIPNLRTCSKTVMMNGRGDKIAKGGHELKFREHLGLCLFALVGRYLTDEKYVPSTRAEQDGTVYVEEDGFGVIVEQTYVPERYKKEEESVEDAIRRSIKNKNDKGEQYASDRTLIVFCDAEGEFNPSDLIVLPEASNFPAVVLMCKVSNKLEYGIFFIKVPTGQQNLKLKVQLESKPYGVVEKQPL